MQMIDYYLIIQRRYFKCISFVASLTLMKI